MEPELEGVDHPLDDRRDATRRLPQRAPGDAAAAGLVPRKPGPVGEEDAGTASREMDRGRRPRRPGTDDEDVEMRHLPILPGSGRDPAQRRTIVAVGAPVKAFGLEILIRADAASFE